MTYLGSPCITNALQMQNMTMWILYNLCTLLCKSISYIIACIQISLFLFLFLQKLASFYLQHHAFHPNLTPFSKNLKKYNKNFRQQNYNINITNIGLHMNIYMEKLQKKHRSNQTVEMRKIFQFPPVCSALSAAKYTLLACN